MPSTLPEDLCSINKVLDNSDEFPSWVQAKQLPSKDGDNHDLQQNDSSLHAAFLVSAFAKTCWFPLMVGFSLRGWWAPGCQGLSGTDVVPRRRQREGRVSFLPLAGTKAVTGPHTTTPGDILNPRYDPNSPGCQVYTCWWTQTFSAKLNTPSFSRRPHL